MQSTEALAQLRALALALPDVTERPSHGMPAWFIGKKQFAVFSNDHHGDGRIAMVCAAPDGMQGMLVDSDPDVYYVPPYVGHMGWIGIRLDKDLAWGQVASLLDAAHVHRGGTPSAKTTMKHTFTAIIRDGAVDVPLDVKALFGEARPAVAMTFCGETFKNRVAVYGGNYVLGIWKHVLEQHGLVDGTSLEVTIEKDNEPRVIEPPAELAAALANNAKAKAGWDAMSYSHQREWATSITDARGDDTRARRVAKAIEAMVAKAAAKAAKTPAAKPAKESATKKSVVKPARTAAAKKPAKTTAAKKPAKKKSATKARR